MLQFGFITFFAVAFPLGPIIALVLNVIEIKARIWLHCHVLRRPFVKKTKTTGIGFWYEWW